MRSYIIKALKQILTTKLNSISFFILGSHFFMASAEFKVTCNNLMSCLREHKIKQDPGV